MKLTVFGAAGKVGRQCVAAALQEGHTVTVFVHRHNPYAESPTVKVVIGDISDQLAVSRAVAGADVVISTLGSWKTKQKNVLSAGMKTIIPAMTDAKISRLITVTGAGAFISADSPRLIDRLNHQMLGLIAPRILSDSELHLRLLEKSDLDWTSLRSPIMTNQMKTGYHLSLKFCASWATIPRAAVVKALLDQTTATDFLRAAPIITR